MEDKMLKPIKYNFIQRIQKRLLIRKLNKSKNFEDYRKSKLKDDPEIMEMAWKIAKPEEYKEFPIGKQIEEAYYEKENIKYFSTEAQLKLFENDSIIVSEHLSADVIKIIIDRDINNWNKIGDKARDRLLEDEDFCFKKIPELRQSQQEEILLKRPEKILYFPRETKKQVLARKGLSSPEWQVCLAQEKDLTISKLFKYMEYCSKNDPSSNKKAIAEFCNSSKDKQELINYLQENENNKDLHLFFIDMQSYLNEETEFALFDELTEMYYKNDLIPLGNFRLETMQKKFVSRVTGIYDYSRYIDIINGLKNGSIKEGRRIFNFLFREKTIIDKVDPDKVIEYIKLLDNYENPHNAIYGKEPTSKKIYRKKLNKMFAEIIKDAFGEKAESIIKNRPGINLNDIPNTEIFSPNIVDNFRPGFVNDLLSYNFAGIDEFIKLAQIPEEIQAFKFYYNTMSKKLGENAVTMQMCISNYPKFQDLLKDASNNELSDEQLEKIESLCSWPANICGIKKLNELENLEERLTREIVKDRSFKELNLDNKKIFGETYGSSETCSKYADFNVFRQNVTTEEIIYDYKNLTIDEISHLSEEEREVFQFFQQQESFEISSIETLKEAKKEDIPLSSIFINQYSSRIKIKKEQMERFNNKITNKEKIEMAAQEGKLGVKILNIDGVELIDLGKMPINFAMHYPNWNNTGVPFEDIMTDNYMLYDGIGGISTISTAYKTNDLEYNNYVYWDFKDNEVVALKTYKNKDGSDGSDALTSYGKKLVVSGAQSNRTIKKYNTYACNESGEIAFYRRKRDHSKEEDLYAGKFAPDALIGGDVETIIASLTRFGRPIPVIVSRNKLSNPGQIQEYQRIIKEAKERIRNMQEEEKRLESEIDIKI